MASYESACYCSGDLGPGTITSDSIDTIRLSGLTTVILWAVHIGRPQISGQQYGDLIFNNAPDLFVSQGKFNPGSSSAIAAWPGQIAQLMQAPSKVSKILFSIGGWGVEDFTSIQYMLGHGLKKVLVENFAVLRSAFPSVAGIDLDCEEDVLRDVIVAFSEILFEAGFFVTFCPYINPSYWRDCMHALWQGGKKISWWNLQCYAGGNYNRSDLTPWLDALGSVVPKGMAASYLMPGLAVQGTESDGQCPNGPGGMQATFAAMSDPSLRGGFLWNFDGIVANTTPCPGGSGLADYVGAITAGLAGVNG